MKVAYTVWTWMKQEFRSGDTSEASIEKFEQALKEISYLGYNGVENFNFIVDVFKDKDDEFDALLKKYNLEFVALYHYLEKGHDEDIAIAEKCCKFMQRHGIKLMNIQAPPRPEDKVVSDAMLDDVCNTLADMGKVCQQYGVTLALHQHQNTACETAYELDYILNKVDNDLLKVCLDTCHIIFGGMDPVEVVNKYNSRIEYVHLKDVIADWKPPYLDGPATKKARALGEGVVDFVGVLNALKKCNYDNVLCVEVDFPAICNYDTAMKSRNYIHSVLGY